MTAATFKPAKRTMSRLRMALTGPSGSGKTYSALLLAKGMGGRVAVIDTEHSSASLYADVTPFDTLTLAAPFTPERYVEAINAAAEAGYNVLIIDSITHEWDGKGGVLEIHDKVTRSSAKGNSYMAWADVTPRHNAFVEAILQAPMHVIVTMRSKTDFTLIDRGGKSVPQKVGMAPIQRAGMEYEFTVVLDLSVDGNMASASKDRTRLFQHRTPGALTVKDGADVLNWLMTAETVQVESTTVQAAVPETKIYKGGKAVAPTVAVAAAVAATPGPAPGPAAAPAVEREPGQDDEERDATASSSASFAADPAEYVNTCIAAVQQATEVPAIAVIRDDLKKLCSAYDRPDDYKRFVAAMKARVAELQAQPTTTQGA